MPVRRVIVFPAWQNTNPYLNLTYLATQSRGHELVKHLILAPMLDDLRHGGTGDVFHMHWTAPICQSAPTAEAAAENLAAFEAAITAFRAAGGHVMWTVHNVLPHETKFMDQELELNRFLAENTDAIHVMSPATLDALRHHYALPEDRVVEIPHPSYQGIHVRRPGDREAAREKFGIAADRKVVLFFGQMRPYKGLDTLLAAFAKLSANRTELPLLLLAGRATDEDRAAIEAALPAGADVISHFDFLPDEDVPTWFAAADLAVFPFKQILNSGSLHLAATLGVPAALPGEEHLREQFDGEAWTRFYDPDEPVDGLARLLADPASYDNPADDLRAFSERLSPWHISRRIADVIDAIGA